MSSLCHWNYYILWFQISINYIVRMKVLERKKDLGCIIGHILLHSGVVLPNLTQEGAALDILQLKIEVLLILETTVDVH